jgi:hypothetical protein
MQFHGIPWNWGSWNFMEFHGKFHGIPWIHEISWKSASTGYSCQFCLKTNRSGQILFSRICNAYIHNFPYTVYTNTPTLRQCFWKWISRANSSSLYF